MSNDSHVPTTITEFQAYMHNTDNRQLDVNPDTSNPWWEDYGWLNEQSDQYHEYAEEALELYAAYIDPVRSTSLVKENLSLLMKTVSQYVINEKLIEKIIASDVVTNTDAAIWNFVLTRSTPTKLSAQIPDVPVADMRLLSMAGFEIRVQNGTDGSRASIPRDSGATAVQYSYAIRTNQDSPPGPEAAGMITGLSTKAHFKLAVGSDNRAKWIIIYFRWYNPSYPEFAGIWSEGTMMAIG